MLLRRSSLVALCISLAFLYGCRRQTARLADINFTHEVSPQPPRVGPTTIVLKLTDHFGRAISGAHIMVEANMSHPGMAPVSTDTPEIEAGRYRTVIDLAMAGDWVVVARASLSDGRKSDYQFEINGVASS